MDDSCWQNTAKKHWDNIRAPNVNNCNMVNDNENRTEKTTSLTNISDLKHYYTNADSLPNKKDELLTMCNIYDPDVLMITETNPKTMLCQCKAMN